MAKTAFDRITSLFLLLLFSILPLSVWPQSMVSAAESAQIPAASSIQVFTLDQTLSALGFAAKGQKVEFRWDPFFHGGVLSFGDHHGSFTAAALTGETGFLLLDNREVFAVPMPYMDRGELFFPEPFVRTARDAFIHNFEEDASRFRIAAIIIDPGHGGKDSGAVGNLIVDGKPLKVVEKDVVLKASQQLKTRLIHAFPDKQVFMTRDSDVFYSLEERVAIANSVPLRDNEAIIYISIHANASLNKHVRGYEVWYLSPDYRRNVLDRSKFAGSPEVIPILNDMLQEEFTQESVIIARSILQAFQTAMGKSMPSRGLKAEEWFVVRNSRMPAVLVELGFVTNQEDALFLTSDTYLRKLTDALYKGIADFVSVFEQSGGFTAAQ
jgi:N-acetylmuramoyl-L-alanine amidase